MMVNHAALGAFCGIILDADGRARVIGGKRSIGKFKDCPT